jgi:AraC-like DNA-binding protein
MPNPGTNNSPEELSDYAPGAWWELSRRSHRTERHDDLEWLLVPQPGAQLLHHTNLFALPESKLVAFWAGLPHRLVGLVRPGHSFHCVVPFAWLIGWNLPHSFRKALLDGLVVVSADTASADHRRAERWAIDGLNAAHPRQTARLLELQAWLLRHANLGPDSTPPPNPPGDHKPGHPARLDSVLRYVHQHYLDSLTLAGIAQAMHLHPNYLTTAFHRLTGLPLMDYVLRERVRHAQRLLATTHRKIIDIAFDSGFRSLSRFYAAFERHCGKSPGDYRESLPHRMAPTFPGPSEPEPPAAAAFTSPVPFAPEAFPFVLWVDDHPINCIDERRQLAALGVHCDSYTCNAEALQALDLYPYRLIISDISRRGGRESGWDLLAALQQRLEPPLPFLFFTDRVTPHLERRARARGAQGIFAHTAPLLEAVRGLLASVPSGAAQPPNVAVP